jgi:peptide deformylase
MSRMRVNVLLVVAVAVAVLFWKFLFRDNYFRSTDNMKENRGAGDRLELKDIVHDMEILRTKCTPVEKIDARILDNLDQMLEMIYAKKGIGLAANQVGLTDRIIVIDLQEGGVRNPMYLINPEIIESSKEAKFGPEGCLSVPLNERSDVKRPIRIKVKYLDRDGTEVVLDAEGLLAVCIQHEIDHLDGILYIDHLSKTRKDFIVERVKSNMRQLDRLKKKNK